MGTTDRSPNDDAQNDTSSSTTSSGNEYVKEKAAVAVDDENEIEGNRKDKTPPLINRIVVMEPLDIEDGSRSVIIEIKNEQTAIDDDDDDTIEKTICRICHLGSHDINQSIDDSDSQLIQLGCGCKDELGFSHMQCAETWFKQKGNIRCEICGMIAKNIRNSVINVEEERRRIYMVQLREMSFMETAAAANMNFSSGIENNHKCQRTICNILMASVILIFFLPWFLHMDIM
ncbi:uncharacterized protein LOC124940384 [Impatiens glandulifera]|uniref:uncharacterized protein LOC124940384 n=1 Tax=Impatiens glandulifera TaxID=253017 RepID=UPI001FB158CA|nr:uncharacterized protein LOC124940384 [Impatiens glandulifera]XP_047336855.1 uncharacterized protein LOC124940384 [Impatiens glandulifera]